MPKYKNVSASLLGLVDGAGELAVRTTIKPKETFECSEAAAAHHLKRGRIVEVASPKAKG